MDLVCRLCLEVVPYDSLVPSPTRADLYACVDCLRGWLQSRAETGTLRDFAAPVDVELGQWTDCLATALGTRRAFEILHNVTAVYIQTQTRHKSPELARSVALLNTLTTPEARARSEDTEASVKAQITILRAQLETARAQLLGLDAMKLRLRALYHQARSERDGAGDVLEDIKFVLQAASTAGVLDASELVRAANAVVLPCSACDGTWVMNTCDGACTTCGRAHCAQCGEGYAGAVRSRIESALPTSWNVGALSEREYDLQDEEKKEDKEEAGEEKAAAAAAGEEKAHACRPDAVALQRRLLHTSRNCPRCGALVTRREACPHMTCCMCRTHFNIETGIVEFDHDRARDGPDTQPEDSFFSADSLYAPQLLRVPHADVTVPLRIFTRMRFSYTVNARVSTTLDRVRTETDDDNDPKFVVVSSDRDSDVVSKRADMLLMREHGRYMAHEMRSAYNRAEQRIQQIYRRNEEQIASLDDWRFILKQLRAIRWAITYFERASSNPSRQAAQPISEFICAVEFAWRRNGVDVTDSRESFRS